MRQVTRAGLGERQALWTHRVYYGRLSTALPETLLGRRMVKAQKPETLVALFSKAKGVATRCESTFILRTSKVSLQNLLLASFLGNKCKLELLQSVTFSVVSQL